MQTGLNARSFFVNYLLESGPKTEPLIISDTLKTYNHCIIIDGIPTSQALQNYVNPAQLSI